MRNAVRSRTCIIKLFLPTLLLCNLFLPTTHAQDEEINNDDNDKAYQTCVDSWIAGLTKNYSDMAQIDIKYVAAYYCLCGFELADKSPDTTDKATLQAQTFKQCMPYAVLRNTLHYDIETPSGREAPNSDVLQAACKNSYPSSKDENNINLVEKFCQCAAKPITNLRAEKSNLSEDQLKSKVKQIARDCANQ